jgi:uncharacterized protein
MKKYSVLLIGILMFIIPTFVFASTTVYERDENNLQVWDDIDTSDDNVVYSILNTPKVDENEKVYDFADLFSEFEEEELYDSIREYIDEFNSDMVIVTINDNNKRSAQEYAQDFYDYNYFGKGDKYDGIIFLIDMDTREMWISTTGETQLMYDNYRIERILDYCYNKISNDDYFGTASVFVSRASYYASQGKPSSADDYYIDENGDLVRKKSVNWILTIIVSLIIPSITLWVYISKHKGIKIAESADEYLIKKNCVAGKKIDSFLTTHTSKIYTGSSSSSGGGRSGGFSSSRGSSGRSHGGGGRRF